MGCQARFPQQLVPSAAGTAPAPAYCLLTTNLGYDYQEETALNM